MEAFTSHSGLEFVKESPAGPSLSTWQEWQLKLRPGNITEEGAEKPRWWGGEQWNAVMVVPLKSSAQRRSPTKALAEKTHKHPIRPQDLDTAVYKREKRGHKGVKVRRETSQGGSGGNRGVGVMELYYKSIYDLYIYNMHMHHIIHKHTHTHIYTQRKGKRSV